MSRSAREATRFTSAGVWANTKPGAATRESKLAFADPAPPNETPQQKVARLREASRRARMAQITTFDKVYFWGRIAADAAHRWTAYFLITSAGVIGVLGVFSIGDMIVYNRRKRREYFALQDRQQAEVLAVAKEAQANGTATPAQLTLLAAIRDEERSKKEHQDDRSFWQKLWGKNSNEQSLAQEKKSLLDDALASTQQPEMEGLGIAKAVEETRAKTDSIASQAKAFTRGGPLDRMAENATSTAAATAKSWTSWISGR